MFFRRSISIAATLAVLSSAAAAQGASTPAAAPPAAAAAPAPAQVDLSKRPKMTRETRMQIMRLLNAEYGFARRLFPMGEKGLTLSVDGTLEPGEREVEMLVAQNGPAARPGDRVQITDVLIKGDEIRFELNGGAKKKKKWYERLQVSGVGGTTDLGANAQGELAKGSYVALKFNKHVPEMTAAELKSKLSPVIDFTVKSAAEAYLDRIDPKAKQAIQDKKVLVGMDREMVTMAKGRSPKKIRERDGDVEYEEWIYGVPPEDVYFIRFVGDEVVQVKIMPIAGDKIVRTERELDLSKDKTVQAKAGNPAEEGAEKGPKRPSMQRPGELPPVPSGSSEPPDGPPVIGNPGAGRRVPGTASDAPGVPPPSSTPR